MKEKYTLKVKEIKFDFDKIIRLIKEQSFNQKQINKEIRSKNMAIIPHPDVIELLFSTELTNQKKQKRYNEKTLRLVLDVSNTFYTNHSTSKYNSDFVISLSYKKLITKNVTHYNTLLETIFYKTRNGNSYDKHGASTYVRKKEISELYSKPVFNSSKEIHKIVLKLIQQEISFNDYREYYRTCSTKQELKLDDKTISTIKDVVLNTLAPIDPKDQDTIKTRKYIELNDNTTNNFNKGLKKYSRLTSELETDIRINKTTVNCSILKSHKRNHESCIALDTGLKTIKVDDKNINRLYFNSSYSKKSTREYTTLNLISKTLRSELFDDDYIELDIENMAFQFFYNKYSKIIPKEKFICFTRIVKSKTKVRQELAKEFKTLGHKENIKIAKQSMISIIFGSVKTYKIPFLKELKKEVNNLRKVISKELNKDITNSELSIMFMKEETILINRIQAVLKLKDSTVIKIHDAILVPCSVMTVSSRDKIINIMSKYKFKINGLDDSRIIEDEIIEVIKRKPIRSILDNRFDILFSDNNSNYSFSYNNVCTIQME